MKRWGVAAATLLLVLGTAAYVYRGSSYTPPVPIESRADCERPVFADTYVDCVREYWRLLEAGEIVKKPFPTPTGLEEYQEGQAARARYEAWLDEDTSRRAAIDERKAREAARARYEAWLAEQ